MTVIDSAESIYSASPECFERRCSVSLGYRLLTAQYVYQHGPNKEAVLLMDAFTVVTDPAHDVRARFREFAENCHRYDDGHGIPE